MPRAITASLLAAAALYACADDDRRPGTDGSVSGVETGSGEGGGGSCTASCEACLACDATVTACRPSQDACAAEPDCAAFRACAGETDDPAAIDTCRTDHPAGASAFCAYWGCLTYEQCDAMCEDAVICPRP